MVRAIGTLVVILATTANAALTSSVHDSRRTFLQRTIAVATVSIGGVGTSGAPFSAANAAYTREVGGPEKSAEQAAYNLQVS
jgi:hypothetical protein